MSDSKDVFTSEMLDELAMAIALNGNFYRWAELSHLDNRRGSNNTYKAIREFLEMVK
jgi:hypothetical protein